MAVLLQDFQEWYRDLMDNKSGKWDKALSIGTNDYNIHSHSSDPRVSDFFLLSSPLPTLGMCIFYAYFSKSLGPRLMANRKPMELRTVLVFYNAIQTIFSAWIFYEVSEQHLPEAQN